MSVDVGNILGIWAHPDDEAWLSAGLMMQAVAAGNRVACVTATRGEAGFAEDDPRSEQERRRVREDELAASLGVLGVTEHQWLGYGDGRCEDVPDEEAVRTLAAIITEVRPDTVLTFGPDGATGHPDHVAVCRWTTQAVGQVGATATRLLYATKSRVWREEFFTEIFSSSVMMVEGLEGEWLEESEIDVRFSCDAQLLPRKVAALRAQTSQIEAFAQQLGLDVFADLVRDEFFRAPRSTDPALIEHARGWSRR